MTLLNTTSERRLVALIASLVLLIVGVNVVSVANAAGAYKPNAPAVEVTSGVTVTIYKDKNHTQRLDPNKDAVSVDQTLYGQINFDFSDAQEPTLDSPNRSYTFPKNINVKNRASDTLYDNNDNVAGTWQINDGVVTAHWNEDWLNTHPSDITSFVSFDFTLGETAGVNGDKEHIKFPGGGEDITITIDKSKVSGKKDYKLNDDGTLTFTVTLNPKFPVKHMVVTDSMGSDFMFVPDTFQLDGRPVNASVEGQKATIDLGDLAKAGKDGHRLTYKAQLTDAAKKVLAEKGNLDDTRNTAQWTWDGAGKPGEDSITPKLNNTLISKNVGGSTTNLNWDVTLNAGSYKFDMGGYTFQDKLSAGQHYSGDYKVINRSDGGKVVASGKLPATHQFTYTFGMDAGRNEYLINYHTAYDDSKSMEKVSNVGILIPHDSNTQPKGEDSTDFTPQDATAYINKQLNTSASTNAEGKATWTSTIYTSRMPSATDPASLEFADNLTGKPDGASFVFDSKPVFRIGDKTLIENQDYEYTHRGDTSFNIRFKGDAVKAAFGKQDVIVTYSTKCSKAPGNYMNRSTVKFGIHPPQGYNASDTIEKTNLVSKTGELSWEKDFDWSKIDPADHSKGAWVATWKVVVNEDNDPSNSHGQVDTKGKPLVVNEELPQGMVYVPGGKYDIQAGRGDDGALGALTGLELDKTMSRNSDGTVTFTLPTADLMQKDRYCKAFATLTYKTAAKATGQAVSFTNSAEAGTGDTKLGSDSATVEGSNAVIDKTADQDMDTNHIRYSIKANPEGVDLVKDADTVTLTDVMDAKGTFIPSTLKVVGSDSGNALNAPVRVENVTDKDNNPTTRLTLTLPDSTPVAVSYDVKPNGKVGDEVNLSNKAVLEGVVGGESINSREWRIYQASSGTEGVAGIISITKMDSADPSRRLSGAKFQLYRVSMDELTGTNVTFDQVKQAATQVGEVSTDDSGTAEFGSANRPLDTNTLYYFVETQAPTFTHDKQTTLYELDAAPHYVMLPGTDKHESDTAFNKAKSFGLAVTDHAAIDVYNNRVPAPVTGSVTLGKKLTGRAWTDADEFTFTLAPDQDSSKRVTEEEIESAMPKGITATAKKTGNGGDGSVSTFTFGDFTFKKAGTYAYTVKETGKVGDGISLDTRSAKVIFTVEKGKDGALTIKNGNPEVSGIDNGTFTNVYTPVSARTQVELYAQKVLDGRNWQTDDSFTFQLKAIGGKLDDRSKVQPMNVPMPDGAEGAALTRNVTNGSEFGFGEIAYSQPGTYEYDISEVKPSVGLPGVTYSSEVYRATVSVTKDGAGLKATVSMNKSDKSSISTMSATVQVAEPNGHPVAKITNTYSPLKTGWGLKVRKDYTDNSGRNPLVDGKFSFMLKPLDKAPMPVGNKSGGVTAEVSSAGEAVFPNIEFTDKDLGKSYSYELSEVQGNELGMTYDRTVYKVMVTIGRDPTSSALVVTQAITKVTDARGNGLDAAPSTQEPEFTNTYTPPETSPTLPVPPTSPVPPAPPTPLTPPSANNPPTPGNPPISDQSGTPGTPTTPNQSEKPGSDSPNKPTLSVTGSSATAAVVVAALTLACGVAMFAMSRRGGSAGLKSTTGRHSR